MTAHPSVLRHGEGAGRVTNVELFFDLVYVFAVTQLSHLLVEHPTPDRAVQAVVLLAMVWQVWVYTTWAVNYVDPNRTPARGMLLTLMLGSLVLAAGLPEAFADRGLLVAVTYVAMQVWVYTTWAVNYVDPNRIPARSMLLVLMLGSLVLAAGLPEAFGDRGLLVAVTYVAMQIGRGLFLIWALHGEQLQVVFLRILPWSATSGVVMLLGAAEHGHVRELLWAASVAIDLVAAAFGFYVPGLGGSRTTEWTISGGHFAERCQAFVLIALGESIVVIGSLLRLDSPDAHDVLAYGAAFAGAVGLWWVYFDRAAEDSAGVIESSTDPGRLARNAFHWVHPLIIGGIIVSAAADERVLEHPAAHGQTATAWLVLGGTALFLGGHALFKAVIWRIVSWARLAAVAVVLVLGLLIPHTAVLTLSICSVAVVVSVAIADRMRRPL